MSGGGRGWRRCSGGCRWRSRSTMCGPAGAGLRRARDRAACCPVAPALPGFGLVEPAALPGGSRLISRPDSVRTGVPVGAGRRVDAGGRSVPGPTGPPPERRSSGFDRATCGSLVLRHSRDRNDLAILRGRWRRCCAGSVRRALFHHPQHSAHVSTNRKKGSATVDGMAAKGGGPNAPGAGERKVRAGRVAKGRTADRSPAAEHRVLGGSTMRCR